MTNYIPGPQAGYLSTKTALTTGVVALVPYPANIPGAGPVPPVLRWVVLLNSSAFTLVVQQGMTLTQIAAFTSDKVQVAELQGGTPITVLPVAGLGTPQTGIDSTVYATWYEDEPPGQYPAAIGSGTTPNSQSTQLVLENFTAFASAAAFHDLSNLIQPWMQALAIRYVQTGGTADAMQFVVADTTDVDNFWNGVLSPQQWVFIPIAGKSVMVQAFPMALGAPIVGLNSMVGTWEIFGMNGPVLGVQLGDVAGVHQVGIAQQAIVPAASNGLIIPFPGSGRLIKVNQVSFSQSVAPAAVSLFTVRGVRSGLVYATWLGPVAANASDPRGPFVVGGMFGTGDPAEGLQCFNPSSQAATFRVTYDLIPASTNFVP